LPPLLRRLIDHTGHMATPTYDSVGEWWPAFRRVSAEWGEPIDRAIIGGASADRVGYAFAAGYQAALRRLVPSLPDEGMASLCVTEEGGGHPRAIKASLERSAEGAWTLSGHKRWATLAPAGDMLLVAAVTGTGSDGRNIVRIVQVDRAAPGVTVRPMPATPFAPEIPHGEVQFAGVRIGSAQVLPGDGYLDYVKPFRTIEDTHVNAAILGYLVQIALRHDWPDSVREELLSLVAHLRTIGAADPRLPEVHLALAGFFTTQQRVLDAAAPNWQRVDPAVRARWERDTPLLGVAGNAREQRRAAAWRRVSSA
jgi:acyl-CoA dehydrogenase